MTEETSILHLSDEEVAEWQPPPVLQPGEQMAALQSFLFDCTWTGSVAAGGMGPGSPEMPAIGEATFAPILNGLWIVCDCEQEQYLNGQVVVVWKAHFVTGWDPRALMYKLTYVDNNGSATLMNGRLEGDSLVYETAGSEPVQLRLTWNRYGEGQVTWRNECSINGGPWFLVEEYLCTAKSGTSRTAMESSKG